MIAADPGSRRARLVLLALGAGLVVAIVAALLLGSVLHPPRQVWLSIVDPDSATRGARLTVRTVRIPRTIAAVLAGAGLAIAGTQMQAVFRNPLADPYVLGVTSGASFAVGIVVLVIGSGASTWAGGLAFGGDLGIGAAAFLGALGATFVSLAVARRVRGIAAVLIVGVMLGAFLQAFVSIMVARAEPARLQQFISWGFGSFRGVDNQDLRVLVPGALVGIAAALVASKPLDALLLGERYAESMGVNVRRTNLAVLSCASVLTGVITAFCGPIGFIGIAAPHLARPLLGTSRHRVLLPAAALTGAIIAIAAELIAQMPGFSGVLPLNAVTALIGAPVVVWVLVRRGRAPVVT